MSAFFLSYFDLELMIKLLLAGSVLKIQRQFLGGEQLDDVEAFFQGGSPVSAGAATGVRGGRARGSRFIRHGRGILPVSPRL